MLLNYRELILDALVEQGKTIKDLEREGVLGKNTFYIFKNTAPSLKKLIKIANYLKVSLDYMLDKTIENNYKEYNINQIGFYSKLQNLMKYANISQSKFCADLNFSRTNFSRWKNGTLPSLSKLIAISNYLNCSIDDLLEKV